MSIKGAWWFLLVALVASAADGPEAGQNPPRDTAAAQRPAGTGRISGVVVAADNGAPVKRADVNIVSYGGLPPSGGRGAVGGTAAGAARGAIVTLSAEVGSFPDRQALFTDEGGRFELADLAPGTYVLMVRPQAGFVATETKRILLKEGETATISIKLDRTGAVTGRILDESGDPIPHARVTARLWQRVAGMPRGTGPGTATDDLGQFRLFDLAPGEYYVAASASPGFSVQAAGATGYALTYYPGVAARTEAQRVIVQSGRDTPGVDFSLRRVPLGRITGTVRDASGRLVTFDRRQGGNVSVMLGAVGEDGFANARGANTKADGSFLVDGITPGRYILSASVRGPAGQGTHEGAFVPVTVNGEEQHVDLQMNLGATIAGRVVIEGAKPAAPPDLTIVPAMGRPRITLRPARGSPVAMSPPMADPEVGEGGQFQLTGVRGYVRIVPQPFGIAVVKSIRHGADDLTAKTLELKGTERLSDVVITFTTDVGRIAGTVTIDGTNPATDAWVIAFPDDPDYWSPDSSRFSITRTRDAVSATFPSEATLPRGPGTFRVGALLPGRYCIVALESEGSGFSMLQEPEAFERLRKLATTVTVAAGETVTIQLRLRRP